MKIALIGPSPPLKGGIAQYTSRLFLELSRHHHVEHFCFSRQYPRWLYPGDGDKDTSLNYSLLPSQHPIISSTNPLTWARAAWRIGTFRPDVLLIPWWVMYWAPLCIYLIRSVRARNADVRVIFICHNVIAHDSGRVSNWLTRRTLGLGDAFIVHTASELSKLSALLGTPQVKQVPHPSYRVPAEHHVPREDARNRLGLTALPTILFFGFVRPYKGLDVLIAAVAKVAQTFPCKLVIAGEIWGDKKIYRRQIEQLGIDEHTRLVDRYIPEDEVRLYFCASDIVVLPYRSATGSGVVKQAYSYRRPVVVSDVDSLADAVEPGQTGYVVEPNNPQALANCLLEHFKSGRQGVMEKHVKEYGATFRWDPIVQSIEQLCQPRPIS